MKNLRDRSEVIGLKLWELRQLRASYVDEAERIRAEVRSEQREMNPLECHFSELLTDELDWLNARIKSIEAEHEAAGITPSHA